MDYVEDFQTNQAKRREDDMAFLKTFEPDSRKSSIWTPRDGSSELLRSPVPSPIAKQYFRRASTSPVSHTMNEFKDILNEFDLDLEEEKEEVKKRKFDLPKNVKLKPYTKSD